MKKPEGGELWRQVTKSVKPLPGKGRKGPDLTAATKPLPVRKKPRPGISPAASSPAPPNSPSVPGFDRQTARKIKRGRMAIESKIDLHGMTQEQAYGVLDGFIAAAVAADRRLVLVITGKGSGTGTTGVLRRNVPHWLKQISSRDLVIGHSEADPKDGGSGALYVRLRKSGRR